MQISRRDLLRSSAAVAGSATVLSGVGGLSAAAVAGTVHPVGRVDGGALTTRQAVLVRGTPGAGGYGPVVTAAGESWLVRSDLGTKPKRGRAKRRKPLVAFAQVSDVHLVDSESPMRVENAESFSSSAYRPQEFLTLHVAESMVQGINAVKNGPATGKPIAFTLQTGDNADNAQYNEVRWNIDILDGGAITPDSGDHTRTESVAETDPALYDVMFWHPEGTPAGLVDDDPRTKYGYPTIPGLLTKARAPFDATGLDMPWYSVIGNHDKLVQGNNHPDDSSQSRATGNQKTLSTKKLTVTADPNRRELSTAEIVDEHFTTTGFPVGHGYTEDNRADGTAYYTFDKGLVRFVVMDTVNANGGDDGSLSRSEFAWIKDVIASSKRKLLVFSSHHPSWSMVNTLEGDVDPGPRVLGTALVAELLKHDNVIAWINGHTHTNNIKAHVRKRKGQVVNGFWEVNTASHIDWPQQGRVVEIADNKDDTLSIFCTMLDHAAPTAWSPDQLDEPIQLAALSRELAANDWQERNRDRRGARTARNVELVVRTPRFLR
ncbi:MULTISPECIES: TIGR03767 family metallophosphoesterase [unclassified Nocardioides]|uniref:TIGR03767 family metallophosphoesterase n=1 Tax=Nocardioides sp. URHA0032 TaxID=1380388 RepID=UPI00048F90A1|nr:TIGR03767 family metallophosphoesterase [Nocardioides sp. URHA0032]